MKVLNFFSNRAYQLILRVLILYLMIYLTPTAMSQNLSRQNLEELARDTVLKHLNVQISPKTSVTVTVTPLDKRIRIKECSQKLEASLSGHGINRSRVTVRVRCPDNPSWHLYLTAKVSEKVKVVVASQALPSGTLISQSHISLQDKDKSKLRGYTLQDPSIIIGAKTNRFISAGQAITTKHVCSVCEGDSVTIVAIAGGLRVNAVGIAKENGSLGDTITVLNRSSNRVIQAKVTAIGTVTIEL